MTESKQIKEIDDIKRYCLLLLDRTSSMNFDDYMNDQFTRLAVERAVMIIGEAATRIRNDYPHIFESVESLRSAVAVRNRLAHGYDDLISDQSIWSVVEVGLPTLLRELESIQ
jgi:uncharacterized protein with HEPN domain